MIPVHYLKNGNQPLLLRFLKKGKRSDPLNYLLISLTSIVFEHSYIVAKQTAHYVLINLDLELIAHSCESQQLLIPFSDDFARALNNKLQVDIGILNLSKAFDKVPHVKLYKKFYGIRGSTLHWFKSFLTN